MIIKSWSGKHKHNINTFKKVIDYINKNAEKEHIVKWNLKTNGSNVDKIINEFKENSSHIKKRKN